MRIIVLYTFLLGWLGMSLGFARPDTTCLPPWQPVNTGEDHTLVILANANLTLNGAPIPQGTYIGVFYLDQNGQPQCGGFGEWQGNATTIAAFGDDTTTPFKDGFASGESFQFRFYEPCGCEIAVDSASFQPVGGIYTNQGQYQTNGISGLASSSASSLGISLTATQDSCGLNVGTASVLPSGGLPPYRVLWSTGDTSTTISNLPGGIFYTVTVSDSGGCSLTDSILVVDPGIRPPQAIFGYQVDTIARVVTFSDSSTGPPSVWSWDYGDGTGSLVASPSHYYATADTYTICLTVSNTCGVDTSCVTLDIGGPCAPPWTVINTGEDHTIVLPQTFVNGQAVPAGSYVGAFFLDQNGQEQCGGYGKFLNGPTAFPIFGDDPQTTVKDGFAAGESIRLRFYEPCGCQIIPDSVQWAPPFGLFSHTDQYATNGISGLILLQADSLNISLSAMIATCGLANGQVSVSSAGGFPPYLINWSTGDTTATVNNLLPGVYTVTVTDQSGCSVTDSITVGDNNIRPPVANFSYSLDTLARNVTFTDLSTGPPSSWRWDYGDGTSSNVASPSHVYATVDTYVVCLNVSNVCGADTFCDTLLVGDPCAPDWSVYNSGEDHTIILPANATITSQGVLPPLGLYVGAFYLDQNGDEQCGGYGLWRGNATSFPIFGDDPQTPQKDGFGAGESIIWRLYEPCTCETGVDSLNFAPIGGLITHQGDYATNGISSLVLATADSLSLQLSATPATCGQNNGTATVVASGGLPPYAYLWNTGDTTASISGLGPGTYLVNVTDAGGCGDVTDSVVVVAPPLPVAMINAADTVVCPGDSVLLDASGNFVAYLWNTGDTTASIFASQPGTYVVTVTDAFGCTDSDTVDIGLCGVLSRIKVMLTGPYDTRQRLMYDSLRVQGLIPSIEPYTALGFTQVGNAGGDSVSQAVLGITGKNAIVDWIFVELRDKNDSTLVVATRSALLQRDGDIVDVDGTSPVAFRSVLPDDYFVAVRHRNHLGFMGANTYNLTGIVNIDFTDRNTPTFGNCGLRDLGSSMTMWSGDASGDGAVIYIGAGSDVNPISSFVLGNCGNFVPCPGYARADLDMNGNVVYVTNNPTLISDMTWISTTVVNYPCNNPGGISVPVFEQLP
jgi:PKD repeat protein